MMIMTMRLQAAADELKAVKSGGVPTKIISLGIGERAKSGNLLAELQAMATPPISKNVIQTDFDNLTQVQQELRDGACAGKHGVSFAIVPY